MTCVNMVHVEFNKINNNINIYYNNIFCNLMPILFFATRILCDLFKVTGHYNKSHVIITT